MKTPYSKKDIEINGLQISYEFLDKASSEKELKITHFITRTYDSYADLFGGLPRNLYSTEYKDFSVWVKHLGGGKLILKLLFLLGHLSVLLGITIGKHS